MENELLNQENNLLRMCKFLLFLLFSLVVSFICISRASASTYYTDYSYHQQYYDNYGSSVTAVTTTWISSLQSYVSNNIGTTANSYGAGLSISSPIPLIAGHTYSLSLFFVDRNNIALSSKNIISVADSVSAAATDYANNVPGTTMLYSNTVNNTILQFVFTVDNTHTVMFIPFTTTSTITQNYVLTELNIDDLGSSGVSQTDIANSLNLQTTTLTNNIELNRDLIIQNQEQLQEYLIESQMVCNSYDINTIKTDKHYLFSVDNTSPPLGYEVSSTNWGITDYIRISEGARITTLQTYTATTNSGLCFYNINKTIISCTNSRNTSQLITIPSNAIYVRFSINKNENKPQFKVCNNGNQATNDAINNLDDTIKDEDIGGSTQDAADFILDFDTNTFGLTSIVTAPLNLIQSLTSSTCVDLELPLPYLNNKKLTLPCMTNIYSQYFGSFFTLYQTITYGIIAYWIIVRIFNQVKDFKNPEHDEIEVVDL